MINSQLQFLSNGFLPHAQTRQLKKCKSKTVLNLKFLTLLMYHYYWKIDLVKKALHHYATILNKSVLEFNVEQVSIEFVKANLITESYFAEELIDYITRNGTVIDSDAGNTIFHYDKIRKTILNALDCYVEGLKSTIKIMTANSADPRSDFGSMEQEIKLCTTLKNQIKLYGNMTPINDKSLI
jgi:hypothetical protein